MVHYLYIFGYNTAEQIKANKEHGWDDEASEAVFIAAESEEAALAWGQQISKRFVTSIYGDQVPDWQSEDYANWIENEPERMFSRESLWQIQVVQIGEHPAITECRLAKRVRNAHDST